MKIRRAAVTTGKFGGWTPICAEQTASGFGVAWKVQGSDQYMVWATDIIVNYVSAVDGAVWLEFSRVVSLYTTFHQDLNGDGVIGVNLPTTVIEALGST